MHTIPPALMDGSFTIDTSAPDGVQHSGPIEQVHLIQRILPRQHDIPKCSPCHPLVRLHRVTGYMRRQDDIGQCPQVLRQINRSVWLGFEDVERRPGDSMVREYIE